jgi:acetyl-CoA synthetase
MSTANYYDINSYETYLAAVELAKNNPELFWDNIAKNNFVWQRKWDTIFQWNANNSQVKWFDGALLNITENCIDRHLLHQPDKIAIIWEPNNPNDAAEKISYLELSHYVNRFANLLRNKGIKKGDRICIYMPMIPELAYALLACARIGAIHSVVFAGFSASALASRIQDASCKMVITADGGYRGSKTTPLKPIVDEALKSCDSVKHVLVAQRTNEYIDMKSGRDSWLHDELTDVDQNFEAEIMEAEAPLFILYTSGSTGKPKGMVHTTAGYMVYSAFSFKNVFQFGTDDIHWCTADIGWITGHSYILYGPLLNGATTLMFEGIPSYPDAGRFWEIVAKHKVTHFYTAPTAIRALAKEPIKFVAQHDLSSLKVLGSVGEPINEEAWHWYNEHVGKHNCPIVDTWWQTETGGIMISPIAGITSTIPAFATFPLPGVQPLLLNEQGVEITTNEGEGLLCIRQPWPSIARTVYGDHQRYVDTYFKAFHPYYFTGDGAQRDKNGNYRITGRVDDVVIVSGHNLGTAPIEDAINEHPNVAESAIVGYPHSIKGNALVGFVILKSDSIKDVYIEINALIAEKIGSIAKLDKLLVVSGLPKTRSGKIMRRILRKIVHGESDQLGDTSTLLDPAVVEEIIEKYKST